MAAEEAQTCQIDSKLPARQPLLYAAGGLMSARQLTSELSVSSRCLVHPPVVESTNFHINTDDLTLRSGDSERRQNGCSQD